MTNQEIEEEFYDLCVPDGDTEPDGEGGYTASYERLANTLTRDQCTVVINFLHKKLTQATEEAKKKGEREIVICSAILDSNNRIFRGHRHHDAIHAMSTRPGEGKVVEQGFMTSKNRFVGRKEAMEIQVNAGLQPESERGHDLFSEDIY